ncbi:hypothetical protein ACEQ8H_001164 [Pleosporales sp. CAS-2024a]
MGQAQKSRFASFWRTAHQQARQDLKARGWRSTLWTICYFFFVGLVHGFVVLATLGSLGSIVTEQQRVCAPDGDFYMDPEDFSFWHTSGFFQITLGFGELTFAQAKVVDVIWDVVVGRGGQALLALLSWSVFKHHVTTSMQVAPVTFNTFRTIFVQCDASWLGVWRLLDDFSRRRALQSRVAMAFMLVTMVYILAFPTLAGAMKGYSANVQPFVQGSDSSYIPFADFRPIYYVIHDGDRIGQHKDFEIAEYAVGDEGESKTLTYTPLVPAEQNSCEMVGNATDYVLTYGSGVQDVNSTFRNYTLSSPTLNITTYTLPSYYLDFYPKRNDGGLENLMSTPAHMAWIQDGRIYNKTEMANLGRCQPNKTYNWGFSFIQVIVMILLLLTWIIGTDIMYVCAHSTLQKRGNARTQVVGEYQAILELSHAMQLELTHRPDPQDKDTESQLRRRITRDWNGGAISFRSEEILADHGSARSFRKTLKREALWLVMLIMATPAAVFCGWMLPTLAPSVIIFPFLIVFAMCVRTTGPSSAVVLFWSTLLLCIVQVVVVVVLF